MLPRVNPCQAWTLGEYDVNLVSPTVIMHQSDKRWSQWGSSMYFGAGDSCKNT